MASTEEFKTEVVKQTVSFAFVFALCILLNILSHNQETQGFFVDTKTSIVGSLHPFFKSFSDFGPEFLRDLIGPASNSALYSSLFIAAVFILLVICSSFIYRGLRRVGLFAGLIGTGEVPMLDIENNYEEPEAFVEVQTGNVEEPDEDLVVEE